MANFSGRSAVSHTQAPPWFRRPSLASVVVHDLLPAHILCGGDRTMAITSKPALGSIVRPCLRKEEEEEKRKGGGGGRREGVGGGGREQGGEEEEKRSLLLLWASLMTHLHLISAPLPKHTDCDICKRRKHFVCLVHSSSHCHGQCQAQE